MALAENGQAVCVTPFTLAGAMAPITIAGALAQQHAEALGVIAFTQMVRPGTPAIYGGFTSNVDMRTGRAVLRHAGICPRHHHRRPARAAPRAALPRQQRERLQPVDAQATYESAMSIWACVMSHTNMLHHGTGWLEGGLCASFEKA